MATTGALVHGRPGGSSRHSGGSWQTNLAGPSGEGGARLRHPPAAALVIPRARVSRAPSYPEFHSDEEFMSPVEVSNKYLLNQDVARARLRQPASHGLGAVRLSYPLGTQ